MDFETAKQEIRNRWREIIPRYLEPAKRKANGETSWICPFCGHGKNGDGLTFDPKSRDGNSLHCFGGDFYGDIIDLYGKMTGASYASAVRDLAAILGISIDQDASTMGERSGSQGRSNGSAKGEDAEKKQTAQPDTNVAAADALKNAGAYYQRCQERLTDPAAVEYLHRRGISLDTARACFVGFDPAADPASKPFAGDDENKPHPCPRIIIPMSSGWYVGRSIDPNTPREFMKMNCPGKDTSGLFHNSALYAPDAQEVFIVEGAFDALSIMEMGAAAMALNSTSNANMLISALQKKRPDAILILSLDEDKTGQKETSSLQDALRTLNVPFLKANICGDCKDPNEALVKDREAFRKAVASAVQEARTLADLIRQKEEEERRKRTGPGMVDAFLDAVQTRKYEPIPTGIADIDSAIGGGFIRQQLILLGAAPGVGKTALAQWIFEGMAKNGIPTVFLNLEMSREQILARSIARLAARKGHKISSTVVLQGYKWTDAQRAAIMEAAEEYKQDIAPRMIYNPDGITTNMDGILEYIEEEAQRAEKDGRPAPCIVLDYLQILTGDPREDAATLLKRAVSALKGYAIRHGTVVFCIMAHNRGSNSTGNVNMESGRDTSALEYSADTQLALTFTACLDREGGKKPDDLTKEEQKRVTLRIVKGRFGGAKQEVDLIFDGDTMTYNQTEKHREAPDGNPFLLGGSVSIENQTRIVQQKRKGK